MLSVQFQPGQRKIRKIYAIYFSIITDPLNANLHELKWYILFFAPYVDLYSWPFRHNRFLEVIDLSVHDNSAIMSPSREDEAKRVGSFRHL